MRRIILSLMIMLVMFGNAYAEMNFDDVTLSDLENLRNRISAEIQQRLVLKYNANSSEDRLLLYADESIEVRYSSFQVDNSGSKPYLKLELLFTNKTDEEILFVCEALIINGCAVDISKFTYVPANCIFLNEWTENGEQYVKYGIDSIETVEITFEINSGDRIRSQVISPING